MHCCGAPTSCSQAAPTVNSILSLPVQPLCHFGLPDLKTPSSRDMRQNRLHLWDHAPATTAANLDICNPQSVPNPDKKAKARRQHQRRPNKYVLSPVRVVGKTPPRSWNPRNSYSHLLMRTHLSRRRVYVSQTREALPSVSKYRFKVSLPMD